jgi:hypothetical protein
MLFSSRPYIWHLTILLVSWGLVGMGGLPLPEAHAKWSRAWGFLHRSDTSPPPPWKRRKRPKPKPPWRGTAEPKAWPPEPRSPENLDVVRFAQAMKTICSRLSEDRAHELAGWIHDYSFIFEVDPFLVGALIHRQSRCLTKVPGSKGVGLTQIVLDSHRQQIHEGTYFYYVLVHDEWLEQRIDVSRFEFTPRSLRNAEASIYFTAALLSIYQKQCQTLDRVIRGVEHRHYVSHFYWGDRVLGSLFEDRVLRDRRRLLWYYTEAKPVPILTYRGNKLFFPLDGVPRVVSGHFGDPRPNGRRHRGVDFYSNVGEPVRAAADGTVFFAGVQHPRRGVTNLRPAQARTVRRKHMGRGGLFVIIEHKNSLHTGYFHLHRYLVSQDAVVKGGQIIGYVGSSGIKETAPHLHFEMRIHERRIDPAAQYLPYLVPEWKFRRHKKRRRPSRRRNVAQVKRSKKAKDTKAADTKAPAAKAADVPVSNVPTPSVSKPSASVPPSQALGAAKAQK